MKQAEFKARGIICFWQYESQFWNDEVKRNIEEAEAETGWSLIWFQYKLPNDDQVASYAFHAPVIIRTVVCMSMNC